jgi:methylmalonyl-CoA/ethylmalonyl-CoA epimerase
MLEKLSSVCIAVNNLQDGIDQYQKLFNLELMIPVSESKEFGYRNAWLGNGKDAFIEILEPTDPDNAIGRFLKNKGEGIYLIEFDSGDVPDAASRIKASGGRVTGIPQGQEPGPETRNFWVHPASTKGVFIGIHAPRG